VCVEVTRSGIASVKDNVASTVSRSLLTNDDRIVMLILRLPLSVVRVVRPTHRRACNFCDEEPSITTVPVHERIDSVPDSMISIGDRTTTVAPDTRVSSVSSNHNDWCYRSDVRLYAPSRTLD